MHKLLGSILVFFLLSQLCQPRAKAVTLLESGKPVEGSLTPNDVHEYQVKLAAGEFLHLVIDQTGTDIVASLFSPQSLKLIEKEDFTGFQQSIVISLIVEEAGTYRLALGWRKTSSVGGRYRIEVSDIRQAVPSDKKRIAAEKIFEEAEHLANQDTPDAYRRSLPKYEEAAAIWHELSDARWEAEALDNEGWAYGRLHDSATAIDYHLRALPLIHSVHNNQSESAALQSVAVLYFYTGELRKSLEYYLRALPVERALADKNGEGITLNKIADIYQNLGDLQQSLEYFSQALHLQREIGNRTGEAASLRGIGTVYARLGEPENALEYLNQAVSLFRAAGDRLEESVTLGRIGMVHLSNGSPRKAVALYEQALRKSQEAGYRSSAARALSGLGQAWSELGEPQKALEYYDQALAVSRDAGDHQGEGWTLVRIGGAHLALGHPQQALEPLSQGQALLASVGDRVGQASALYDAARAERVLGHLSESREKIERAISMHESVRGAIAGDEMRTSYSATGRKQYEFRVDLLMQLHREHPAEGWNGKALQASEHARARGLLDLLGESHADVREGVEPALLERERSLEALLQAKTSYRVRGHGEDPTVLEKELPTLLTAYEETEAEIRARSPRYAALTQPQPLTSAEIQRELLDADTELLEYATGDDRSFLWVVTPDSLMSYELPARTEIEAAARGAYEELMLPGGSSLANATNKLSRMLLGPLDGKLSAKRLLVVVEGALQYVPFGALHTARGLPLIVEHEIVSLPSASTLAILRSQLEVRKPAPKLIAVLADPVFDPNDPRVSRGIISASRPLPDYLERSAKDTGLLRFDRLVSSRREADAIVALAGEKNSWKVLDFDASRRTATSGMLAQYRIVHFASHGLLDSHHPELSGIVLSLVDRQGRVEDGFLQAHEIYNLKLNAELVVLSACQTALGKDVRGEGLISLTRAFMYAGAPRVVASLWRVPDQATAELMKRFYRAMLSEHVKPAAALQAAQISLQKDKRWEAPYYWAGFILQGEWK
jgi:CHAT domain-containing protein/tetratricopeptide (TPR) repeat protein